MKRLMLASAMVAALGVAGVANAGPLGPPGLDVSVGPTGDFIGKFATTCGAFSCIAGEGAAVNTLIGKTNPNNPGGPAVPDTAIQHIDWIVVHDFNKNGGYTYYYQLENSSIFALGGHTINTPEGGSNFAEGSEFLILGIDLDLLLKNPAGAAHADPAGKLAPGQDAGPFANLFPPRTTVLCTPGVDCNGDPKPEFEFGKQKALVGPSTVEIDFNGDLLVTFKDGLKVNTESGIYGAQGTQPTFGPWNTQGGPFTWNSENENPCTGPVDGGKGQCEQGIRVPIPTRVPEPASLLLLSGGLLGLGFWARRRRQI